jgi:hypothetical protein
MQVYARHGKSVQLRARHGKTNHIARMSGRSAQAAGLTQDATGRKADVWIGRSCGGRAGEGVAAYSSVVV